MKLTPEDLEKVRTKNIANILRKQAEGKTLTSSEQKALAAAVQGDDAPPLGMTSFVTTWDDLARALNVEERTLYNFRQRHPRQIHELGAKLTRADGRHSVEEWRKLADELGELKGRGLNDPYDNIDERKLRLRERLFAVEKAEHKLKMQTGEVRPLIEYQNALRVLVGAFDGALKQIPGRVADRLMPLARQALLTMLRAELTEKQFARIQPIVESASLDYAAVVDLLDNEIEACRRALAEADFMEADPDLA